jgi:hypothetical protein
VTAEPNAPASTSPEGIMQHRLFAYSPSAIQSPLRRIVNRDDLSGRATGYVNGTGRGDLISGELLVATARQPRVNIRKFYPPGGLLEGTLR